MRNRFYGDSLHGRLLRRLIIPLALILLAGSFSAYWSARRAADIAYDRSLLASARAIADGLHIGEDGNPHAVVPYAALDAFVYDSAERIYYQVLQLDGVSISGHADLPAPPPGTSRTDDYPALARFYDSEYRDMGMRIVSLIQPISEPPTSVVAEIRVAETLGARERLAHGLLQGTLWRMGLLSLTALLLVWFAVSAALRPLERLRRELGERTGDDLRPLAENDLPRELWPLAATLNQFNARLRGFFERQSQFIADAAHELRTPLAALRARIELGLRENEALAWKETLEGAARNTETLTHLANRLLSLARIESGARAIAEGGAQRLDLTLLARELGLALAPLAHAKGIDLALEAQGETWVNGDAILLNELLCNLLDNALAHAPKGGCVTLRVLAPAILEVEDDGPGIPAEEREKVFERFYRRDPRTPGAGLGLAIVGEICRAHRATIALCQGDAGGVLARVAFPPETI